MPSVLSDVSIIRKTNKEITDGVCVSLLCCMGLNRDYLLRFCGYQPSIQLKDPTLKQ